jgi:hypothetical protein
MFRNKFTELFMDMFTILSVFGTGESLESRIADFSKGRACKHSHGIVNTETVSVSTLS